MLFLRKKSKLFSLERLPVEVVEVVALWAVHDLKNLRLVSRHVNEAAQRAFWATHTLTINFGSPSNMKTHSGLRKSIDISKFNAAFAMLLELQQGQHLCRNLLQKLEIKAGPWAVLQSRFETETEKFARETLPGILPEVLSSLEKLESVKIEVMTLYDPEWFYNIMFPPLAALPRLHELVIEDQSRVNSTDSQIVLPLSLFRHGRLTKFTFQERYLNNIELSNSHIFDLIRHNPRMTHLNINRSIFRSGTSLDLNKVFEFRTLPLEELCLLGCKLNFSDPNLLPSIRSLRSVNVVDHESYYPHMWQVLSAERIHLQHIRVRWIVVDFVDYLRCWQGLETFWSLYNTPSVTGGLVVSDFLRNVLHEHRATLREIHVGSVYDSGPWIIGLPECDAFDKFRKLESVSISIRPEDVIPGDKKKDVITVLLTRLVQLPAFTRLSFLKVERTGRMYDGYLSTMDYKIGIALEKTKIPYPRSSQQFQSIKVVTPLGQVFVGTSKGKWLRFETL